MSFDQEIRGQLARMVGACRQLLLADVKSQLASTFGLRRGEGPDSLDRLGHLTEDQKRQAQALRDLMEHFAASAAGDDSAKQLAAYDRVVMEIGFTVLNRLAALRLCEERGLVIECIRKSMASDGFRLFEQFSGGALGNRFETYRLFLQLLFDELAIDLGVLFDGTTLQSAIFPSERCFEEVATQLNDPALKSVWTEDETIGWIYQYWNDPAERKKMREDSAAPRNSRELAVRNQFFTPRYVVEFLTDNTLGRIWYEMCQGQTRLRDQCHYLVRRPNEVFLKPGEIAPDTPPQDNLSQEELLRQPVHIPHRPLKDPRTILMLDPACGSMHFGLYAFDLFEAIYEESWEWVHRNSDAAGVVRPEALDAAPAMLDFIENCYKGDKAQFMRDVPRLIIEHNIHGIDIDPRCTQIAGLSLWLRAQKTWQRMGLIAADRPRVLHSNVVCAEPMPGEKELLREFVERGFPAHERGVFLRLLEAIFDKMQLAGEAGSLLKIEEEIRSTISEAKEIWREEPRSEQALLFARDAAATARQLTLDLTGVTDEQFWEQAEGRIYSALRNYAEQAEGDRRFQRRLFSEDAGRGFAFIDLCRKRYDVALMNPPFGDASLPSKPYIEDTYGDTKGDVYKAFVECFQARLLPASYLGIISSRTGFFLTGGEDWRTRVVLRLFRPIALADLGMGVLDAMVEVAAYVLRSLSAPEARDLTLSVVPVLEKVVRDSQDRFSLPKWQAARGGLKRHQAVAELKNLELHGFIQRSPGDAIRYTPLWHSVKKVAAPPDPVFPPLVCVRGLADNDKGSALLQAIANPTDSRVFVANPQDFKKVPSTPFAYWVGKRVRDLFTTLPSAEADDRRIALGLSTKYDFRFVRVWWEVDPHKVGRDCMWGNYANGGSFSPFYFSYPGLVLAENGFAQLRAYINAKFPYLGGNTGWVLHDENDYRSPAIAWPLRSHAFSPTFLPTDYFFSARTYAALVPQEQIPQFLGLFASKTVDFLLKVSLGRSGHPEFVTNVVRALPVPEKVTEELTLGKLATAAWRTKREIGTTEELSHAFEVPALLAASVGTVAERAAAWAVRWRTSEETVAAIQAEIDDLAFRLYGLAAADRSTLTSTLATKATGDAEAEAGEDEEEEAATADATALAADLLGYGLGVVFGRWDIRYATDEQAAPELPDPFAPLPVCPPGQLQNAQGLPARPEDVPAAYPFRISWDGILADDPNHPLDIERRIREVIEIIWSGREGGQTAEAIEHEACEILVVNSLRDYFRKPAGFFADHLKRYSKSRRQAPIYWPLSTASGSYTLWIYYHRLTDQTLFQCVKDFVQPKLDELDRNVPHLRDEKRTKDLQEAVELQRELEDFKQELLAWAPRWKPNLNDGVLITASPLWKLFRLPRWRKALEACWKELERGDYDWAHLAYTLWPDRVREKCRVDRSLAIAHGLEEICEAEIRKASKPGRKRDGKASGKTQSDSSDQENEQ